MRKFLAMGICQSCGAKEILTHVGYRRRCRRCDANAFIDISQHQKTNYMTFGSVHGERKERKFHKKNAS